MFAIIICLLQAKVCMGQNQKVFEMAYPKSKTISVNEKYSKSIIIYPFKQKESLYSLSVSAKVQLNGYKSLVRVVLINENGEEYLVLESYYMIEEQKQINFTDYGDETAMLNGVGASSIKIEIEDASILLETVSYNNSSQNKLVASGVFMIGVIGGALLPLFQGILADMLGGVWRWTWLIVVIGELYILYYGLAGSKVIQSNSNLID